VSGIRVKLEDARAVKYCAAGMRVWGARHGLDFAAFAREGIPVEIFEAIGDAMGLAAAAAARARAAANGW
jgi:hypothetical protein